MSICEFPFLLNSLFGRHDLLNNVTEIKSIVKNQNRLNFIDKIQNLNDGKPTKLATFFSIICHLYLCQTSSVFFCQKCNRSCHHFAAADVFSFIFILLLSLETTTF